MSLLNCQSEHDYWNCYIHDHLVDMFMTYDFYGCSTPINVYETKNGTHSYFYANINKTKTFRLPNF